MRARTRSRFWALAGFAGVVLLIIVVGTIYEGVSQRDRAPIGSSDERAAPVVGEPGSCAGKPADAPREMRAMWLTTVYNIDFPSQPGLPEDTVKAEYRGWLDLAQRHNHNAIYVHIRPSGDAFWPSQYAPWSEWLTGKRDGVSPGWDPLAWMVAETHARNLEFHAWFNPYRGGQPGPKGPGGDLNQLAPNHPLRAHPEWSLVYPAGTSGSRLYFDPGIPAARKFVEDSMLEAVQKYDIDGVDFDDFFYPYPEAGQDFPDANSFATYGKGFANKADWRRDNVNTLVREMNERIKALKPWVKFGISPFGIWRNKATDPTGSATNGLQSFDQIYADTRTWVKQHWLDSITPQLYWNIGFAKADYATLLPWWSSLVAGTGVQLYIAQADYRVGEPGPWQDAGELDRQMTLNQKYKVDGTVHFSAKSVRTDALGAVSRYGANHYAAPALMPVMANLPAAPPGTPVVTAVRSASAGSVTVTWRAGAAPAATSYAVYRLDPGAPAAKLVGTTRQLSFDDHDGAAQSGQVQYCVSGLDRSYNEGKISSAMALS
jgi:uncharacterized lipoprotein YddW (UPF0748 family)